MATTYKAIATVTVGSGGASSIDFTSISSAYTDLVLVYSLRQDTDDRSIKVTFNGNTSSIYTLTGVFGSASTVYNQSDANATSFMAGTGSAPSPATANTFGNCSMYIPNYASTTINKSVSFDHTSENNAAGNAGDAIFSGLWASTSAINQITITPWASKFVQYSTAYLYGIKNS